jgi:hypothetical protein
MNEGIKKDLEMGTKILALGAIKGISDKLPECIGVSSKEVLYEKILYIINISEDMIKKLDKLEEKEKRFEVETNE